MILKLKDKTKFSMRPTIKILHEENGVCTCKTIWSPMLQKAGYKENIILLNRSYIDTEYKGVSTK